MWGSTPGPQGVLLLGPALSGKSRVWQDPGGCGRAEASRQTWKLGGFPIPIAKGNIGPENLSWFVKPMRVCRWAPHSAISALIPKVLSFSGTTAITYRLGRVGYFSAVAWSSSFIPDACGPVGLPQPWASGEGRIWQSQRTGRLSHFDLATVCHQSGTSQTKEEATFAPQHVRG